MYIHPFGKRIKLIVRFQWPRPWRKISDVPKCEWWNPTKICHLKMPKRRKTLYEIFFPANIRRHLWYRIVLTPALSRTRVLKEWPFWRWRERYSLDYWGHDLSSPVRYRQPSAFPNVDISGSQSQLDKPLLWTSSDTSPSQIFVFSHKFFFYFKNA